MTTENTSDDEGFGLVEIVVAMLVLAALALLLLPLLVQGLQLTARNSTIASGVQQVNDVLQRAQDLSPDCEAITDELSGDPVSYIDGREVEIVITTTVGACPTEPDDALVVEVAATAVRGDTGDVLADASTLVYVSAVAP